MTTSPGHERNTCGPEAKFIDTFDRCLFYFVVDKVIMFLPEIKGRIFKMFLTSFM
jgi:hypothetical protein